MSSTYDLGDVVALAVEVRDTAGDLADATAITLTITLPDGTTATPVTANPSTGRYTASYTPTVAGRFSVRWVASGTNASAYTDAFTVLDPAELGLVGLDDVKRHVALAQDSRDGLEVTPMLLLGVPGIGKTHFARKLADLLGTGMSLVPMGSMTAGWLLSGASSQWKGAKPGKVFEALVDGEYANPVIVVDEIDKASTDAQYDPLGALYSLLEHDTAQSFTDEFAEVAIDASQVIWITTANDERAIPDPILNRMNVFQVLPPDTAAARQIARNLYQSIRADHDWGQHFVPEPGDDLLDQLADLAPRDMRRALMTGFGNARLDMRDAIAVRDLPRAAGRRSTIGFVQ